MNKYTVRIGSEVGPMFNFTAKSISDLKIVVKDWVENLNPLNSSAESREEYKSRFRDEPLYLKEGKDYKLI